MDKRKLGYYWVKYDGNWIIAKLSHSGWLIFGGGGMYLSSKEFEEIDENRIVRI